MSVLSMSLIRSRSNGTPVSSSFGHARYELMILDSRDVVRELPDLSGGVFPRPRTPRVEVPVPLCRGSLGVEPGEPPVEHSPTEPVLVEVRHPRPLRVRRVPDRLKNHVVGVVQRLVHVHVPREHDPHRWRRCRRRRGAR